MGDRNNSSVRDISEPSKALTVISRVRIGSSRLWAHLLGEIAKKCAKNKMPRSPRKKLVGQ